MPLIHNGSVILIVTCQTFVDPRNKEFCGQQNISKVRLFPVPPLPVDRATILPPFNMLDIDHAGIHLTVGEL